MTFRLPASRLLIQVRWRPARRAELLLGEGTHLTRFEMRHRLQEDGGSLGLPFVGTVRKTSLPIAGHRSAIESQRVHLSQKSEEAAEAPRQLDFCFACQPQGRALSALATRVRCHNSRVFTDEAGTIPDTALPCTSPVDRRESNPFLRR